MIKAGQIIENDQGKFAKVVSAEKGRYGISAFVFKKEDAERQAVAVRTLNTFGLSQVVKDREQEAPVEKDAKKAPAKKAEAKDEKKDAK